MSYVDEKMAVSEHNNNNNNNNNINNNECRGFIPPCILV
jgi:hypothetical protein